MRVSEDSDERQEIEPGALTGASLLRKLLHLAMASIPAAGWWFAFWVALALLAVFGAISLAVEVTRRWWPGVNRLLWNLLPTTFRSWEDRRVLGSTWFATGALVTLLLFGRDAGGTAVLMMAWGDPVAELVGRRWGGNGQGKTLVGSFGCLAACLLAAFVGSGLGGLHPGAVLAGALVATLAERWSPPPDDNVWMPIFAGVTIAMVQWLLGGECALFTMWR